MEYILDTHAFIWYAAGDKQLSTKARNLIDNLNNENQIFLSIVSIWEISIKLSIGKLEFKKPLKEVLDEQIELNNYQILDIKMEHTEKIIDLPFHHRDPFDRLLIGQSIIEKMPIISIDENFEKYQELSVVW
ncbi:MAG: PIN domain nuclease [uncultured Aureispira sp.]|uniref:PIN domain nuclease n=1 Tax=uncultured Aureispira sp. TaxID=1331704 RepID=A0A6S6SEZ5_9BACT|nr:MAG: PIN domain nuclease [uncultured Aureispira sp.]